MKKDQAVESVAKELSSGNPLMTFKPDDVEQKFFVGEAIIVAAATAFVTAFMKGVNESLEEHGEEIGKTITNWLVDKIAALFRKPKDAKTQEDELKKELHALSQSASKLDKKTIDVRLDVIEKRIETRLEEQGVLPKKAKEIARKSRVAAVHELSKVGTYGTQ